MSRKQHLIRLNSAQRSTLEKLSCSNRASIREKTRARILLLSDESYTREHGASRTDAEIVEQLGCSALTVYNVRRRAIERGAVESIRRGVQHKRKARKLDGRQEAQLVALTCSTPPEGHARWSLVLLREKMIEMQIVEHIGLETVRSTLKKTRSSRGSSRCGVSHPRKMLAL
jgi:transposase